VHWTGQEVKGLEDETDLTIADFGELVVDHRRDIFLPKLVAPCGGRIEAAEHVH